MLSTSARHLAALLSGLAVATQAVQLEATTQGPAAGAETMMAQAAIEAQFNEMMESIDTTYLAETEAEGRWWRSLS